jgi:hypothetical protein
MAECYRKEGNRNAAVGSYQRLLKDFADQTKLAAQSRAVLATTYKVAPGESQAAEDQSDRAKFDRLMEGQKQEQAKAAAARAQYRATIEEEMALDEKQLSIFRERAGAAAEGNPAIVDLQEKIIRLKRDLAAFDAGMPSPVTR